MPPGRFASEVNMARENHQASTPPQRCSWFQRNPKKTLAMFVFCMAIIFDRTAGFVLIPKNYDAFRIPHPFYHHDLRPKTAAVAKWGDTEYPLFTNSLGFRDRAQKTVALATKQQRLVLMGDSFLEGLAVPYEQSAGGLIAIALQSRQIEVLNAAAVSYSPKLYYLKMQYLLEHQGFTCDELMVFIDISDIQNEIAYELFEPAPFPRFAKMRFELKKYFERTSFIYAALAKLGRPSEDALSQLQAEGLFPCLAGMDPALLQNENFRKAEGIWTIDPTIYEQFGRKGLALAEENMEKLVELCQRHHIRLSIVVYPWPAQIVARDLASIQVTFWEAFAQKHQIEFINVFPAFINDAPPQAVYDAYFIRGDVHWNVVGHALVADAVLKHLSATAR